jgi:hypothetical protein
MGISRQLILHNPSYGCPWTIPYTILKITTSLLFPTHQHGYQNTNQDMHFHVHDIYIIQIKLTLP